MKTLNSCVSYFNNCNIDEGLVGAYGLVLPAMLAFIIPLAATMDDPSVPIENASTQEQDADCSTKVVLLSPKQK